MNAKNNRVPRILVVGSFVLDLIVSTSRFPEEGETVLGEDFNMAPGGKGANQAVQMARLGSDVTMVGAVGQDMFGETLLTSAKEAGIDVSRVLQLADVPSAIGNVQLELSADGQTKNRIIVVSGANMQLMPEHVAELDTIMDQFDYVVMQQEIPADVNLAVAQMAERHGVPIMLNPAPSRAIDPELLRRLTVISPNEHEARAVASQDNVPGVDPEQVAATAPGAPANGDVSDDTASTPDPAKADGEVTLELEEIRAIGRALHDQGIPELLVTLGERGAILLRDGDDFTSPAVRLEEAADPTAAGDSFIGAFVTAKVRGLDDTSCLVFANHCAALTVSKMGAQSSLPTLDELMTFMEDRGVDPTLLDTVKQWS